MRGVLLYRAAQTSFVDGHSLTLLFCPQLFCAMHHQQLDSSKAPAFPKPSTAKHPEQHSENSRASWVLEQWRIARHVRTHPLVPIGEHSVQSCLDTAASHGEGWNILPVVQVCGMYPPGFCRRCMQEEGGQYQIREIVRVQVLANVVSGDSCTSIQSWHAPRHGHNELMPQERLPMLHFWHCS